MRPIILAVAVFAALTIAPAQATEQFDACLTLRGLQRQTCYAAAAQRRARQATEQFDACLTLRGLQRQTCYAAAARRRVPEQPAFEQSRADEPSMTFASVCRNHNNSVLGCFVHAKGIINQSTPEEFNRFLEQGGHRQLLLDSDGGDLIAGITLGRIIRAEGIRTFVGDWLPEGDSDGQSFAETHCYSACAYAFLGGDIRRVTNGARLGFHQFFISSENGLVAFGADGVGAVMGQTQALSGLLVAYIVEMGVDARVFVQAAQNTRTQLFVPNADQLNTYNITSPEGFSDYVLEPVGNGVVATSTRVRATERYDEVLAMSAFCRGGKPVLSLYGNKYSDVANGEYPARLVLELGGVVEEHKISKNNTKYFALSGNKILVIEVQIPRTIAQDITDAKEVEFVSSIATALGGPYPFKKSLSESDRRMLSAAFKLCV